MVDIVCCITMLRNKSDIYYFITATTSSQFFLNSNLCREKAVVLVFLSSNVHCSPCGFLHGIFMHICAGVHCDDRGL